MLTLGTQGSWVLHGLVVLHAQLLGGGAHIHAADSAIPREASCHGYRSTAVGIQMPQSESRFSFLPAVVQGMSLNLSEFKVLTSALRAMRATSACTGGLCETR